MLLSFFFISKQYLSKNTFIYFFQIEKKEKSIDFLLDTLATTIITTNKLQFSYLYLISFISSRQILI